MGAGEWLAVAALLVVSVFWPWMLLDALLHQPEPARRLFWVALIFLTWVPGALLYALSRQGRRGRRI